MQHESTDSPQAEDRMLGSVPGVAALGWGPTVAFMNADDMAARGLGDYRTRSEQPVTKQLVVEIGSAELSTDG